MGHDNPDERPSLVEEVQEKGWDNDELVKKAFVGPEDEGTTEIVVPPEWRDNSEEGPGYEIEETEDGKILKLSHEGLNYSIENEGFNDWRIEVHVPEELRQWLYGPGGIEHSIKTNFRPQISDNPVGYVERVDKLDERGLVIIARAATNFQPVVETRVMIEDIVEWVESQKDGKEDIEAAFEAAKENAD